jgi:muramidase (phage lysozyme)
MLKFRETAWLLTLREFFKHLSPEDQQDILRKAPADCDALANFGMGKIDTVILKLVEVKAYELEVKAKGQELSCQDKIDIYEQPMIWGSLVQELAEIEKEDTN